MFDPWWLSWLVGIVAALLWGWFAYGVFRDLRARRRLVDRIERELWDARYWPKVRDR